MASAPKTQFSIGDAWLERCAHPELANLYVDGQGVVGKQCSGCLQVFPYRACDQCGRLTTMREHDKHGWYCSKPCKRQSAAIRTKGGAQ